jgi:hypothetical protein
LLALRSKGKLDFFAKEHPVFQLICLSLVRHWVDEGMRRLGFELRALHCEAGAVPLEARPAVPYSQTSPGNRCFNHPVKQHLALCSWLSEPEGSTSVEQKLKKKNSRKF